MAKGVFRNENFKRAFLCTAACFTVYLIAFASPYWLQTYHSVPLDFKNMGLWEICFGTYYFRDDSFAKPFEGCYWSLGIDLQFKRDVFNPGFFLVVQVFSVVVLIALLAAMVIMCLIFLRCVDERPESKWWYLIVSYLLTGLTALAGVLLFVMVVIVGVKSGDRRWMPRADLIWLSWAYAFAVLASALALIAAYFFGMEAKGNRDAKPPEAIMFGLPYRQADAGLDPPDHESVFQ